MKTELFLKYHKKSLLLHWSDTFLIYLQVNIYTTNKPSVNRYIVPKKLKFNV